MPAVTLATLRDRVRRYADQQVSEFRNDDDLDDIINVEWAELYDILVTLYEDFFEDSHDITAVANTGSYSLAAVVPVVEKLRGVSYLNSDVEGDETEIERFEWAERTQFGPNTLAGTVRVFYIPRVKTLVTLAEGEDEDDLDDDEIAQLPTIIRPGWEDFIARGAAAKLLLDEQNPDAKDHLAEKEAIRRRIMGAAGARDANAPRTIIERDGDDEIPSPGQSTRYCLRGLTLHLRSAA